MKRSALKRGKWKRTYLRYGPLFDIVKVEPCFGKRYLRWHTCGLGLQWTAHHVRRNDEDGLLPVCGAAHLLLHSQPWKVDEALSLAGHPTKEEIALEYVERAKGGGEDDLSH